MDGKSKGTKGQDVWTPALKQLAEKKKKKSS